MKGNDSVKPMRGFALSLAVVFSVGACTDTKGGGASPTVPTAVSTSSTSVVPDVSVIPEKIDEAYLNAVLAALDEVDGQATRLIVATKRFPPEAADLLNSIYSDQEFDRQAEVWFASLANDPQLKGIRANPGNRKTKIERIIAVSPSCVWMAIVRDHSAVNVEPGPVRGEFLALQPLDQANDPRRNNPTAWMMTYDGYLQDDGEPSKPC